MFDHNRTPAAPTGAMDIAGRGGGGGHDGGGDGGGGDNNGSSSRRWTMGKKARGTSLSQHFSTPPRHDIATTTTTTTTTTSFIPPTTAYGHVQRQHASTIRAVTSDDDLHSNFPAQSATINRSTTSSKPLPTATTSRDGSHTIASLPSGSESLSQNRGRLSHVHEWEREVPSGQAQHISPPNHPHYTPTPVGMLARSDGRNVGNGQRGISDNSTRPRTKTLEERSRRDRSPATTSLRSRNRMGSVHSPESISSVGSEYMVSGAAHKSPRSVPSGTTHEAQTQILTQLESDGRRSTSPVSPKTSTPLASVPHSASHRRVRHLMRTLNGGTSGSVLYRRTSSNLWTQSYCYTGESTAALMCESRTSEGSQRTLIPNLRGCVVRPRLEGDTPYLEVVSSRAQYQVQLKLLTQADFDAWYATLMFWAGGGHTVPPLPAPPPSSRPNGNSNTSPTAPTPPAFPRRQSSAHAETTQGQRERAMSSKSDRRKSVVSSHKESPVIKIGKMIFWDTSTYTSSAPILASLSNTSSARPTVHRLQSYGSRRWRRISGQLRENGELKLHSDADNSLISVVELSQLSRCALQRLDSSVLDCEFCIGIYPQYMAVGTHTQPGFVRPIFLSLENRVLYEVWFVLLRAFTVPQLYGPSLSASHDDGAEHEDLAALPASTTHNMFRVERSLMVTVKEAKLYTSTNSVMSEIGYVGGHSRGAISNVKGETYGHYAEVLLDNETRGKTTVKYEVPYPAWNESFEFLDLPSTLQSAGVVIKRRPPDTNQPVEHNVIHEALTMNGDSNGGFTGLNADVTCGRVDISELEEEKEVEKWWPLTNALGQQVGDIHIKVRADERVILMARDYQPLSDLLHRFDSNLTLHIAQVVHSDLKRLSDCFLSIFQVSGKVSDWLVSLVEDEIDGLHKETPISRLRQNRRVGSEAGNDNSANGGSLVNREAIVRDMNKNATLEANLLFRGNTLLTKSLDTHMRRVGKEYLEQCLSAKLQEIRDKDLDCEVDPNKVSSQHDLERNWRRLNSATAEVWRAIFDHKQRCPIELRIIFKHIRACAEDTYGDFSRSVSYSSVSGFLFLRFFCPAVLNPKLFGLMKDEIKPRARRTLTLIAKSLQTMANLASFGTKEHWMEPMNSFLNTHRDSFKMFIDDVCYVPAPITGLSHKASTSASPAYAPGYFSSETSLSYTTPMTIMQRLPPTSREGFPSLPYLIDQARAFADLVQLWLEAINPKPSPLDNPIGTHTNPQRKVDILQAIQSESDFLAFHETCEELNFKTLESLNRAERADPRPTRTDVGTLDPIALIDSLQDSVDAEGHLVDNPQARRSIDLLASPMANDPTILPREMTTLKDFGVKQLSNTRDWNHFTDDVDSVGRPYDYTSKGSVSASASTYDLPHPHYRDRPGSAGLSGSVSSIHDSFRRVLASRGSDNSPISAYAGGGSTVSSAVSSDTEHATTALPSYEREIRHRERRAHARELITQHVEQAKLKAAEKKEKKEAKPKTPLAALRKKRREKDGSSAGRQEDQQLQQQQQHEKIPET